MERAGFADGDEIIADRVLTPRDGSVVVAIVAGELLIRRLLMHDGATSLATEPALPLSPVAASRVVGAVNRTGRLYAIVEELRAVSAHPRSARWLAARFEVSSRTIERDVNSLPQSGLPMWMHVRTRPQSS